VLAVSSSVRRGGPPAVVGRRSSSEVWSFTIVEIDITVPRSLALRCTGTGVWIRHGVVRPEQPQSINPLVGVRWNRYRSNHSLIQKPTSMREYIHRYRRRRIINSIITNN